MIKRVNVRTKTEIRNIETPIYSNRENIVMNTKDIRTCLMRGAYVYEIFDDGSVLRLNLNNYNKENTRPAPVVEQEPVVISNPTNEDVPVITETVEEPAVVEAAEEVTEEPAVVEAAEEVVEEPVAAEEVTEEPAVVEAAEEVVEEEPAVVEETTPAKTTNTSKKKKK